MTASETPRRVYLVACHLIGTYGKSDPLGPFQERMKELGGKELMRNCWAVASEKPATVLFLELEELIENERDSLVVAEVTANSFGTYIPKRDHDIAALIGSAHR